MCPGRRCRAPSSQHLTMPTARRPLQRPRTPGRGPARAGCACQPAPGAPPPGGPHPRAPPLPAPPPPPLQQQQQQQGRSGRRRVCEHLMRLSPLERRSLAGSNSSAAGGSTAQQAAQHSTPERPVAASRRSTVACVVTSAVSRAAATVERSSWGAAAGRRGAGVSGADPAGCLNGHKSRRRAEARSPPLQRRQRSPARSAARWRLTP